MSTHTTRPSGTELANAIEYAASLERDRKYPLIERDGLLIIAGVVLAMVIVFAWLWRSV